LTREQPFSASLAPKEVPLGYALIKGRLEALKALYLVAGLIDPLARGLSLKKDHFL
jgi:hypothetical protein